MVTGITGGGHLRGAPWTAEFLTHYLDIYIYIYPPGCGPEPTQKPSDFEGQSPPGPGPIEVGPRDQ
jgi:hypothetical protein